jgi:hypothetical protein
MLEEGRSFLGAAWVQVAQLRVHAGENPQGKRMPLGCMVLHVSVDLSIENSCDC